MKKQFLLFFYLLVGLNVFYAQKILRNDSLEEYSYSDLKDRFYEYNDNGKTAQSKAIAKYFLQKAKKNKSNLQIADGYVLVHFNENFSNALKYLDSANEVSKNLKGTIYPSQTYLMKGNLYYKHDNLKFALDNYVLGLKYAKKQKDEKQIAYANMNIAYLNSYIGKNLEAAKIFRHYLYNGNNITDEYQHNQMRVSLIYCYIELNELDSANILIKEGQASTFTRENIYSFNQYSYYAGYYNLKQKRYKTAIDELSKAYDYFSSINDDNANYTLYNLGKAYDGLKNREKTILYFNTLDSNILKNNITFPELREVYTYLIDYYKENNNKEKQLYYIDRFLKVDKKLDEQFRYLSVELPEKYDTPKILEEKESIINDLKDRKTTLYFSISILLFILLSLSYLYYKSKKTERKHKKIAQHLIQSIEKKNLEALDIKPNLSSDQMHKLIENEVPFYELENQFINDDKNKIEQFSKEIENKAVKTIPEDVLQYVLRELTLFENKELFLKKGITLANLAKNMKTNTAYLSEIINRYKGKNFAAYLNDLRIDYALNKLVEDKRFRSYKLSVIAEELGYNNEQAFSLAFKKKTGTTLSIYIKEIEHTHINPTKTHN